jgi:hypothetical protein
VRFCRFPPLRDVLPPVLLGSGVAWQQRWSSVDSASRAFDTRTIGSGVAWQQRVLRLITLRAHLIRAHQPAHMLAGIELNIRAPRLHVSTMSKSRLSSKVKLTYGSKLGRRVERRTENITKSASERARANRSYNQQISRKQRKTLHSIEMN